MSFDVRAERLLILIPAYNEQDAIREVVSCVKRVVPQSDVLVVDDGSADNTAQEAAAAGAIVVRNPFNLNIGGAVQTGLKFAQQRGYSMVIRVDGDGQHNAADIAAIYAALQTGQADAVFGSRFLSGEALSREAVMPIPWSRRVGIRFFALLVSCLTRSRATDTTSGFMGLNRRAVKALAAYMPQDYPEVESRILLHKAGLRTLEIPTCMRARETGISSINSWSSGYYALKVSIAVLTAVFKEIPSQFKEVA
jgi:glycosyltransferase involved in cell wall biosynthesis